MNEDLDLMTLVLASNKAVPVSGHKLGARWVLHQCGEDVPREGISIAQLI